MWVVCKYNHGLKNNTMFTLFFNLMKQKSARWSHCQSENGGPSVLCLTISKMSSSRNVFDLNNRKSGANRHMRFCQFPKNSEVCHVGCVLFIKPWHHTLHISKLKYAPTHGTLKDRHFLTGSDVIARSFSSLDWRIESTVYYSLNHGYNYENIAAFMLQGTWTRVSITTNL